MNPKYPQDPVELTRKLIEIPSYYPFEAKIVEFIKNLLKNNGFKVELIPVENRYEILAFKGNHQTKPYDNRLLFFGHLDTVPIQGVELQDPTDSTQLENVISQAKKLGWNHSPFEAFEEMDQIYGLGAVDMKAPIAALLSTACRLPQTWFEEHQLVIAFTVAEEHLSQGVWELVKHQKLRGIPAAICGEILDTDPEHPEKSAGGNTLVVGRRGRVAFDITVFGTPAHAAMPHAGINAIEEATRLIAFLQECLQKGTLQLGNHEILPPASMTPLSIKAGTSSLSIPAQCKIVYDRHLVPPETFEQVESELQSILEQCEPPVRFMITKSSRPVPFLPPYQTSLESPIVRIAQEILRKTHDRITITGGNSVADENMLGTHNLPADLRLEIPLIVLGAEGGNFHQINEWVSKPSIYELENHIYQISLAWQQYYHQMETQSNPTK